MKRTSSRSLKILITYLCLGIAISSFAQSSFLFHYLQISTTHIIAIIIFTVTIILLIIYFALKRLKESREKKVVDAIELVKKYIAPPQRIENDITEKEIKTDDDSVNSSNDEWLKLLDKKAKSLIENKKFSIVELAASMNLSERQFRRKLKQKTNMLPVAFMREIRLQKAKQLLISGNFPTVALVCYEVGFSTPKHFSKLFLERFGKNPSFFLENNSGSRNP